MLARGAEVGAPTGCARSWRRIGRLRDATFKAEPMLEHHLTRLLKLAHRLRTDHCMRRRSGRDVPIALGTTAERSIPKLTARA